MLDKSLLEKEIKRYEVYKRPLSIYILIVLLFISLCAVSVYTFKLKQMLSEKKHEIILTKNSFQKEKIKLLNKIKRLEEDPGSLKSNSNNQS